MTKQIRLHDVITQLYTREQAPDALRVRHDLVRAELALAEDAVDERDGHLADAVP